MMAKRRTSKEPEVSAASPFAPIVEAGRSMIRALVATLPEDDTRELVLAKVEGMEAIILLCQRAGAGEKIGDGRPADRPRPPEPDRLALLERRVAELEARARPTLRVVPAILEKPRPTKNANARAAKGARRLLIAIAQSGEKGATSPMLAVLTQYKPTSRRTYLQQLAAKGWMTNQRGRFIATAEGLSELGKEYEPLPTGDELRTQLLDELPPGESTLLAALTAAWPNVVTKEELRDRTGYQETSIRTYAQKLSARELVHSSREGWQAVDALFSAKAPR